MSEISQLERTRNHLRPGEVSTAVRRWKDHVRRPERDQWRDYEGGDDHWDCCGDPFEARVLLDTATRALSRRSARELRQVVSRVDGGG
ncbi:hypothetical protein AB0D34_05660 [Streptomyces sp. NPDC048420]|uniref:hypothetical protein n=1 Tax=Streptomyces sp. NPDC048420 TaxID=3155755 RepID=UPI003440E03C